MGRYTVLHKWTSALVFSLREPFFAQQSRSMAAVSAMQPHMRQAVTEISQRMRIVDLVIEMRDARIPHTSANFNLINMIRGKPRLLLLNKADLAHRRFRKETLLELESSNQKVLFTCTSSKGFAEEVLAAMKKCISDAEHSTQSRSYPAVDGRVKVVMVVGTPNVGKTSLINAIRRHACSQGMLDSQRAGQLPVGPLPGVTKHVSGIKVSDNPTTLLIDTPGIMLPKLTASTFAYRVALAGLVQETSVKLRDIFAFMLYVLAQPPNKTQLKAVLAEPIPDPQPTDAAPQPSERKHGLGTQATIRWAFASKKFAKCALQAIDEVLALQAAHGSPPDGAGAGAEGVVDEELQDDVWLRCADSGQVTNGQPSSGQLVSGLRSSGQVTNGQLVSGQRSSGQLTSGQLASGHLTPTGSGRDHRNGAHTAHTEEGVLQCWGGYTGGAAGGAANLRGQHGSNRSLSRPQRAADYLALLQCSSPQAAGAPPSSQAIVPEAEDGMHAAELAPMHDSAADNTTKNIQRKGEPLGVGWLPYDTGLWEACGEIMLRKLVKPSEKFVRLSGKASAAWEPPPLEANAAMEKAVRLVRGGHLGKLVFEVPPVKEASKTKRHKAKRGRQALHHPVQVPTASHAHVSAAKE